MVELPTFLRTQADFEAHLNEQYADASGNERGDRFVKFALSLCPLIPELEPFGQASLSPTKSHDMGVDIVLERGSSGSMAGVQAKLRIKKKDDIDIILSKFKNYEENKKLELRPDLFDNIENNLPHFAIITGSNLNSIINRYKTSHLATRLYYDLLVKGKRLHVIDGEVIFALLQAAYKKAFGIPNDVTLTSPAGWIQSGNVWIGVLTASHLINMQNRHGEALFFENIREFLGEKSGQISPDRRTVNEQIVDTAISYPEKFLGRNNGITFRAQEARLIDSHDLCLTQGSIVNGCQTTMCLVTASGDSRADLGKCLVQTKVVVSEEAWDVALSANYQNRIDYLDLVLAKFLRPQVARKYALPAGVSLSDLPSQPAINIINYFYETAVRYEEIKALYIGIFSNSPNNVDAKLYTKIRVDIIEEVATDESLREKLFDTLFKIASSTEEAVREFERKFANEDYMRPYIRIFKERRDNYRAFLTLLCMCAMTKTDLSQKSDKTQEEVKRLEKFLEDANKICETKKSEFQAAYARTINMFCTTASGLGDNEREIQQYLNNMLKKNFTLLYQNLCRDLAVTEHLQQH